MLYLLNGYRNIRRFLLRYTCIFDGIFCSCLFVPFVNVCQFVCASFLPVFEGGMSDL